MLIPSLIALLTGCDVDNEDLTIDVAMVVGDDAAACGTDYMLGTPATSAQLADARVFLHDVELHDARLDAWSTPVSIDNDWQNGGIILLDGEDGSAGCSDSGTAETNLQIDVNAPDVDYDGIRFTVGVPTARNHLDAATAPAPLNTPGMFWTWQGGFKHVRVDYLAGGARWNVHMGSTGCDSAGPTVAPTTECANGNRGVVTIMDFDPRTDTLELDLAALVADADVSTNTLETPPGCMSSPMEPAECDPVYAALGLDFATGDCVSDCADQNLFR